MKTIAVLVSNKEAEQSYSELSKLKDITFKVIRNIDDLRNHLKSSIFAKYIIDDTFFGKKEAIFHVKQQSIKSIIVGDINELNDLFTIVSKPFSITQMAINLESSFDEDFYKKDNNFVKINDFDFSNQNVSPFDVFIKLDNNKIFVKVINEKDPYLFKSLIKFKNRGIQSFYVTRFSYNSFIEKKRKHYIKFKDHALIPNKMKLSFLNHTNNLLSHFVSNQSIDKEKYLELKETFNEALDLIMADHNVQKLVVELGEMSPTLFNKTLTVTLYSVLISKKMGWNEDSIGNLISGCILSDISLYKEDLDYKNHPLRSKDLVTKKIDVNQNVIAIIEQHHENLDGSGFPVGLIKSKIHPYARLVRVSNELMEITHKNPTSLKDDAKILLETQSSILDDKFLKIFIDLF